AVANAFSQTLRVGQYADGPQSLRVAFQEDALARVRTEGGGDDFYAQAQLNEIQVCFYLSRLQLLILIFSQVVAKGLEDPIGNYIIRGLRGLTIFDLLDAIRFQAGDFSGGQGAGEIERRFDNAAARGRRR